MKNSRSGRSRHLQYENLESRQLMAVTAGLSGGVLSISGTSAADTVALRQTGGVITIAGLGGTWNASQVNSILIDLKGGTDNVSLHSLANGGKQALAENITIKSGAGNEKVFLMGATSRSAVPAILSPSPSPASSRAMAKS